jgi:geranylgeranyl reductase family protein
MPHGMRDSTVFSSAHRLLVRKAVVDCYDAVVIGGGPAGSTCAWKLRQAGLNVCVLDRAVFPRDKVCAGWITPPVLDTLELDQLELDEYRQTRVFQPITAFRTSVISRADTETRYSTPVSFGIRRCEFDDFLLKRARVHLRCGQPITSLRRRGKEWIINDAITTPVLVGAGGHFCPVARYVNRDDRGGQVVAALEAEFELNDRQLSQVSVHPEMPQLYFCDDFAGYGWCFRKGRFLNVGLGRLDPREIPRHARSFLEFLVACGVIPSDVPMRLHGHAYLLGGGSPRKAIGSGVLLVGDAAGLAEPHSGEGIRPAVESGVLAARAILNANGHYDEEALQPYRKRLHERFGAPRDPAASAVLPSWLAAGVGRRVMNWRWFTRHVVLDRWFLGRQRPPLTETA